MSGFPVTVVASGGYPVTAVDSGAAPATAVDAGGLPVTLVDSGGLPLVIANLFSPADLFASGETGAWYDPSDLSSMWQDDAGTVAAVVDQPVGRIDDKSGGGHHATQATAGSRPILRSDGGLYYLEFDGSNDFLATANIDLSGASEVSIFAGVEKSSSAARGALVEFSSNPAVTSGVFGVSVPRDTSGSYGAFSGDSSALASITSAGFATPETVVVGVNSDKANDSLSLRRNSTEIGSSSTDQGGANFSSRPLYIGMRGGSSLPFNGRLYGLVVRGLQTTGDNLTEIEAWLAEKSGVEI